MLAGLSPETMAHIPAILTHRMAAFASPACISRAVPRPDPTAFMPAVTLIVPSAGRSRHVLRCLRKVTSRTRYQNIAVTVILSSPGKPAILRGLARLPGVSVIRSNAASFNYATVNNEAADTVDTEFMLLLNDDVIPVSPDWLHAMVAHMQDPNVGIVGARLLYGNGMVQHEGVIMGLANLCEHAGRLRQGSDPGLHGLGLADRQVCAVTAACLLIRTALYRELGGMDTAYAVALNDVDLCLRAREAGWRVIYAAGAELVHYESLSLGRHYAGERASLESREVRRLRSRFASVIASDPFYSPNASLQPGREWQPAFPPRQAGPVMGVPPHTPKPLAPG
jgi:GT2 family glycosyltransferase